MTPLEPALEDYISIRRSLGSQLRQPASLLRNFVTFLRTEGASRITTTLVLRWATQPTGVEPYRWAARLGMVRRFAIWYSAIDPSTEIPSADLLPFRRRRKPPHIYSDEEIERILRRHSNSLRPRSSVPSRLQLFLVCWWQAECGSTKPLAWIGPMSTLIAGFFRSGSRSSENRVTCRFIPPPLQP